MRRRLRHATPLVLAALALAAAAALPTLAHVLTTPQRAGDHAAVLRAHLAWARVVAFALVAAACIALARVRRADAARGARQGIALLLVASTVCVAASLPAYDAWLDGRIQARYLSDAPEWQPQDMGWRDAPESRGFTLQRQMLQHQGPVVTTIPTLEKGDRYQIFVSFRDGDIEGFHRTDVSTPRFDACEGGDGQMPLGRPTDPQPVEMSTFVTRTCTASAAAPTVLTARWGLDEPVDAHVSVILHPSYANVVQARMDESLALVSGALALGSFLAVALSTPRGAPASREELAALALGPILACALWGVAAMAPRGLELDAAAARAASGALATLAFALALLIGGLVAAAWLGHLRGGDALRWSSYAAVGLAAFTPVPAIHIWRYDVPSVVLGMLGTLVLASLALVAAGRLTAATRARDEAAPG